MGNLGPRHETTSAAVGLCALLMLVSLACFMVRRLLPTSAQNADQANPSTAPTSAVSGLDAAGGPSVQAVFDAYGEYGHRHEPDGPDCG